LQSDLQSLRAEALDIELKLGEQAVSASVR
jgi:hypothetical protein